MADLQHTTRRVCLKAAPLILVPAAVVAGAPDDETFALIEAYRVAERAFNDACGDWDAAEAGSPECLRLAEAVADTGNAMDAAGIALCEYAPPTTAGSKAKAEALLGGSIIEGSEIEPEIRALVRSLAQMVRA